MELGGVLEDRVQLSQWWHPLEYRWLLEAKVLGHFGLDLTQRLSANAALVNVKGYPSAWNEAVLTVWSQKPLSAKMLQTLSKTIPSHCIKTLEQISP